MAELKRLWRDVFEVLTHDLPSDVSTQSGGKISTAVERNRESLGEVNAAAERARALARGTLRRLRNMPVENGGDRK